MYMAYIVVHFTMVHHIIGISLIWYEIQTDNKNLLINNSYYSYRPYQNYQQIKCHQLYRPKSGRIIGQASGIRFISGLGYHNI